MNTLKFKTIFTLCACFFLNSFYSPEIRASEGDTRTWIGTAAVDITPPIGVPLAGFGAPERRLPIHPFKHYPYATYLKPSIGVHDPIQAKAFVIKNQEHAILFMSLDLIGVDYPFYMAIKNYAKTLGIDEVVLGATHTHSGPGDLSRSWLFQLIAADRFVPKIYAAVLAGAKRAVDQSLQTLELGSLYKTHFTVSGIQRNRRNREGHFDPEARLMLAKNERGEVLGGILNFAVHPIAMDENNLLFSADLAGGLERHLMQELASKGQILFMNGAEGDVSTEVGGFDGIEKGATDFAAIAHTAKLIATPMGSNWSVRSHSFTMPKAGLALWACDEKTLKPIFGKKFRLGIGKKALPRVAEVKQVVFNDGTLMMSWPGEPTTDLGIEARAMGTKAGYPDVWNLGLTNGYMGYFVTGEEFDLGGYEVCVAYHGPKAGSTILNAHQELFDSNPR